MDENKAEFNIFKTTFVGGQDNMHPVRNVNERGMSKLGYSC